MTDIITKRRLIKYNKTTLAELVLECRDRFNQYNLEVEKAKKSAEKLQASLEDARKQLKDLRKFKRENR
jgi:predicted nuclease with TOPRIM domain